MFFLQENIKKTYMTPIKKLIKCLYHGYLKKLISIVNCSLCLILECGAPLGVMAVKCSTGLFTCQSHLVQWNPYPSYQS